VLRGFTFFFLGAQPGVADKAAANLKARFPDLRIVSTHHDYFDKTPGSAENEAVIEQMAQHPHRRLWHAQARTLADGELASSRRRHIDANVALIYVSGELRRLWKRYLIS
jgi:hypothetical protein